jgi:hypothetical protein
VLQQIGNATNPYALRALAEALQAVPAKLTEAQAQQALAPVLQQINGGVLGTSLPWHLMALVGLTVDRWPSLDQRPCSPRHRPA